MIYTPFLECEHYFATGTGKSVLLSYKVPILQDRCAYFIFVSNYRLNNF